MAAGIAVSVSTGVMKPLLDKLATLMGDEFSRLKNLRKEVKFISDELTSMKDVLERLADVDELDPQTKTWRDIVREMSYDTENIIDDFMQKIGDKNENDGLIKKTIRRLKTSRARHQIAGQLEQIKKLVCETSERRGRYLLDIPPSSDVTIDPRVATLYKNASSLVGVEGPANELISWLKDEEMLPKVVSIVGFGGLGKTTLANEIYRRLKKEFDCGVFVPVSQKPNIPQLLHTLIYQLGIKTSLHASELHYLDLIGELRKHLQDKSYLIIIDDIWDVSAWDVIKCAFPENDLGSRVIATTRIVDVAKACSSHRHDYILNMKPLCDKDSRRLFFGRIFGSEEVCPDHLRDVSVQVLKKCGGLPLAIISISGLLASEDSNQKERWEYVRNSLGSGTNLTLNGMRQILNLSYKTLPPRLKTCLLYLGMYPEDYTIERSDLERQWMAEGFVCKENGQDAEKVARNCFNELVNRSIIQPAGFDKGSVTHCKVHDMMLDLILLKSADENFLTIVDDPQGITELDYKVRRLSLRLDGASKGTILPGNISLSQVRSVMIFGNSQDMPPLSEFKFLRVLRVVLGHGEVDLTGVCKLYQLRYLKICGRSYKLPTQIRGLRHLETLDVMDSLNVPSDIVHLPCLLFLKLGGYIRHQLPGRICNMKSLRYLKSAFDLETNSLDNIKGLGELANLRSLRVVLSRNAADRERRMDALCSSLGKICTSLECLDLHIDGCIDGLMALSPPPCRLERLNMYYVLCDDATFFSRVPSWMEKLCILNELKLTVRVLLKDGVGILAELPSLTHLKLYIKGPVREMIAIYGGAFPVLKCFIFGLNSPSYLTFQAGAMPMLQRLEIMFNAKGSEQKGPGPAGIEHLSALEELTAEIGSFDSYGCDDICAESAFRSAIDMHPNHPHVAILNSHDSYWDFGDNFWGWESADDSH